METLREEIMKIIVQSSKMEMQFSTLYGTWDDTKTISESKCQFPIYIDIQTRDAKFKEVKQKFITLDLTLESPRNQQFELTIKSIQNDIVYTVAVDKFVVIKQLKQALQQYFQSQDFYLIKGGKMLDEQQQLQYYEIFQKSTLNYCIQSQDKGGARIINFCDVQNAEQNFIKIIKTGPKYRSFIHGLNFFGTCENDECVAFQKEVVCPYGYQEFSFSGSQLNQLVCPECSQRVDPKTCGISNAQINFDGSKLCQEKNEYVNFSDTYECEVGKFKKFVQIDGDKNTSWTELVINVYKIGDNPLEKCIYCKQRMAENKVNLTFSSDFELQSFQKDNKPEKSSTASSYNSSCNGQGDNSTIFTEPQSQIYSTFKKCNHSYHIECSKVHTGDTKCLKCF